jgi:hypothetical protein
MSSYTKNAAGSAPAKRNRWKSSSPPGRTEHQPERSSSCKEVPLSAKEEKSKLTTIEPYQNKGEEHRKEESLQISSRIGAPSSKALK